MRAYIALSLAVALPLAVAARAQDTRTVTEPKFPAACATLTAELTPVADTTLAEQDEGSSTPSAFRGDRPMRPRQSRGAQGDRQRSERFSSDR